MTTYTASWREYANCATSDPEVFYPPEGGSSRDAAKVCGNCLVQRFCLNDAMTSELGVGRDQRHGVRGGKSAKQRREYQPQWLAEQAAESAA